MSLSDWARNGWLVKHQSSAEEINNLMGITDRDLRMSQIEGLDPDWRFAIAYNAALQAATAALAAEGYRAAREAHHYRVIESLELTIQAEPELVRKFDAFRKKRNFSNYEAGGLISEKEAAEMRELANSLRVRIGIWIGAKHPELKSGP